LTGLESRGKLYSVAEFAVNGVPPNDAQAGRPSAKGASMSQATRTLVPFVCRRVAYGERTFHLSEPMQVHVDNHDGVWVHEYEPLGIIAAGDTRAESLDAFRMDFAACYDLIAQEEDGHLTLDARELKKRMLALVERVEKV